MGGRTYRDPYSGRLTTVGELDRERNLERNYRRCVRCGNERPAEELFIGPACQADPDTMREVRNIEEGFTDPMEQRRALMLFGWAGGWWRK